MDVNCNKSDASAQQCSIVMCRGLLLFCVTYCHVTNYHALVVLVRSLSLHLHYIMAELLVLHGACPHNCKMYSLLSNIKLILSLKHVACIRVMRKVHIYLL